MRREVPLERVLFAVLLGVSLLLLSLAMLRSDMAAPAASTHTFRDGFIVADRVERRTETATPADATDIKKSNAMLRREGAEEDASKAPAAAAIHVSGADAHTTTIKMEGGDEITIKRAASSKNKITTISTHEDGKITIENRDKAAGDGAPAAAAAAVNSAAPATPAPSKQAGAAASVPTPTTTAPLPAKKRSVDFVGEYDATEKVRGLDATDADPHAAVDSEELGDVGDGTEEEEEAGGETLADDAAPGDNTHEIVVGKKKVTFVNVGRSETKVSLSDVAEDAAKLQTSSR